MMKTLPAVARATARSLAACAALAACDTTPVKSALALAKVDPLTTRADALQLAVAVPDTVRLRENRLPMTATLAYRDGRPGSVHRFDLVPVKAGAPGLGDAPGEVTVFALDGAEAQARFTAFQSEVRAAESAGLKGSGALSTDPPLCRTTTDLPPTLPVIVYIKTAELARFVPLNRPLDTLQDARRAGADAAIIDAALPRCT
ncbi:hypothetical protein [Pseudaestuariivita atlantica]|uniref:Lipoprotein n=1 Tax=Pseudaestuariivita atlantica TaxID=1317121 RepID=A0A0L1JUT1_9RHOB|nr:hypothetical protein [Pseudaestuariivita atlantica]KNG95427.1 hypothetical protein ATO11_02150 [Pseudaestuariivita atlantica]